MNVGAYIPCCNNSQHLEAAIQSLREQTCTLNELLVIDDGSTDGCAEIAARLGARVIRHPQSLGRGAVRARAFVEAECDLLLGLDATCTVEVDFIAKALPWFKSEEVAGVFARIVGPSPVNAVERWRARHLFGEDRCSTVVHGASLITTACVLRRASVLKTGNFSSHLKHSEDFDLGQRLLTAGWDVVQDPALKVLANKPDSLLSVLERFWRWHAGTEPGASFRSWCKMLSYAVKVMMHEDLRASDPLAAGISFLLPHYQVWRSLRESGRF